MVMNIPSLEAKKSCPVSKDIRELKKYFEAVKDIVHDHDKITDINLLSAGLLNKIDASERCCFLLKLGTFYVTNIFPQVHLTISKMQREFSNLANSMLGLKIELKQCHATMRCPCGEQAQTTMEEFKNGYYKLKTQEAVFKAIGEMNIIFHWIEKNFKS
ncbi:interleukin-20-like [Engystomops pustulosus]|uniref:interleukin-20-like n=1 Tax=Engystomops pustulosus TaxID=76066 RepID=UPI003AFA338D